MNEVPADPETSQDPGATPAPKAPSILGEVIVYSKHEILAKYSIEHGEYIIGRDASCHILVDADAVSRHHARLTLTGFELLIEDMGSSNGVFIDGVQVQIPTRVRPDQEVQIGSARLRIGLKESATKQLADALWDKELGLEPLKQELTGKKYRVLTAIGRGGMGVVMQARDLRIRRTVAMKVMKTGDQFSPENVLRFIDEAQVTGQLEHPNIVPVYELGLDEHGETYYTMKHVRGITLDEVLEKLIARDPETVAKYSLATLITIFQKICDGVAFAHSRGVVHRDLKPENIMIGAYGEVLVMDWGLAKNITGARRRSEDSGNTSYEPVIDGRGFETLHGLIVGTPPYISPEQARGELDKIDARSDIFVLGEILYTILTLRTPFKSDTLAEVLDKILASDIEPPTSFNQTSKKAPGKTGKNTVELVHCPGKRIPEGLSAVVMKAMHLEPEQRYASVEEMQADITAWQGGFATKAERAGLLKHVWLFVGRHRTEMVLFGIAFVVFNVLVIGFIYQLAQERDRATQSEQRAIANAKLASDRLSELRGTAPTFYQDAKELLDQQEFESALEKINYALQQLPNEPDYHNLRGNVLQSLSRWPDALAAYQEALRRNPQHVAAKRNLEFTERMIKQVKEDGKLPPSAMREFHAELIRQGRLGEALGLLKRMGRDRGLFSDTWKAALEKRGLKNRVQVNDDDSFNVDLSRMPQVDLQKLSGMAVSQLSLNETRLTDLSPLKGSQIKSLSISRTQVSNLWPLSGMPLKSLTAEGTRVSDLKPLSGMPLETLRISDTPVTGLEPLRGCKRLNEFVAADCRELRNISALKGLPLRKVNLSRTAVKDLMPLTQSPIRELNLAGCTEVVDIKALADIRGLEALVLPPNVKDISFLRGHPTLRFLSYSHTTEPVEEFWKEFRK